MYFPDSGTRASPSIQVPHRRQWKNTVFSAIIYFRKQYSPSNKWCRFSHLLIFCFFVTFCYGHTHAAYFRMANKNSAARGTTASLLSSYKAAKHLTDSCSIWDAQLGELDQGLSSIRTVGRPNKRNDCQQRQGQVFDAVDPVSCVAQHWSRTWCAIPYEILHIHSAINKLVDILHVIYKNDIDSSRRSIYEAEALAVAVTAVLLSSADEQLPIPGSWIAWDSWGIQYWTNTPYRRHVWRCLALRKILF